MGYRRLSQSEIRDLAIARLNTPTIDLQGLDLKIKYIFLNLPKEDVDLLLYDYGQIYGKGAQQYAKSTFYKWRTGQVSMSIMIMERLFDFLPKRLPLNQKYEIANDLWERYCPKTVNDFKVNSDVDVNNYSMFIFNSLKQKISSH
jgi:hypothetical protein